MLKNYFLVALRNVMRNRVYTLLNVFGLALGIACGLIAFWFIRFQTSYDSFHENKDRIFQINTLFIAEKPHHNRGVPPPMSEAVRKEMPNLKASMCVERNGRLLSVLDANGKPIKKFQSDSTTGAFVEPHYFEIFSFPWLVGKHTSMDKPDKIALSEKLTKLYFGNENPIGKLIRLDNQINLEVVGIFANIAENTELRHDYFISFETLKSHKEYDYGGPPLNRWEGLNSNTYCYTLFPKNVSLATMKPQIDALTKKYHPKEYKTFQHHFVPFRDIRFIEDYQNNVIPVRWLWIMASIGAFLILTACFNFINMATAQAMRRAKEVGVRKAVGGSNRQIFSQFMTETGIIVFFALLIGIGLGGLILPYMNIWLKINLWASYVNWADGLMWLLLLSLFIIVTLLAGTYPALVLAGFKPIIALKGSVSTRQIGGVSLRRVLIVFQFVWIQLLLICMLIINQQMTFMQTADIGYTKAGIVTINIPRPDKLQQETFRQRMMQINGVENLSFGLFTPTANSMNTTNIRYHTRPKDEIWSVSTKLYDIHFLDTYGLKLVAGTNIPKSDTTNGYLVNEETVKRLGINNPQEVVGKNISVSGNTARVYGVLKNWHTNSLQRATDPVAIYSYKDYYYHASIRFNTKNLGNTMREIQKLWSSYYPDDVFRKDFLDEFITRLYESEQAMLNLIRGFSFIAIFIGCLGMFGLIRFLASQKTKEIGVRKAYGATVGQILYLFVLEMLRLVVVAFVIAVSLSYYLMSMWLDTYAYRIDINTQIGFLAFVALSITFTLAILTIGYEAYKAAVKSPSLSLKSE